MSKQPKPVFIYNELLNEVRANNARLKQSFESKKQAISQIEDEGKRKNARRALKRFEEKMRREYVAEKDLPRPNQRLLNPKQKSKITSAHKRAFPNPPKTNAFKIPKIRGESTREYWRRVSDVKKQMGFAGADNSFAFDAPKGARFNDLGFLEWADETFVNWLVPIDRESLVTETAEVIEALRTTYEPVAIEMVYQHYRGKETPILDDVADATKKLIRTFAKYDDGENKITAVILKFFVDEFDFTKRGKNNVKRGKKAKRKTAKGRAKRK